MGCLCGRGASIALVDDETPPGADDETRPRGIRLAPDELSPAALRGLVEEFVTRDGTDYGAVERGVEEKIAHVLAQLAAGEACIVFDPEAETANIVTAHALAEG